MDPAARFAELLAGRETALPLDEACLCVAAHAHPGLDVAAQLARLDQLAAGCREPTLDGLRRHLFRDLGFRGNAEDYYDPRNSYLDDVLDRRTGLPITLSVVTMEVGRRLGAPLDGVSLPGHFLLRDRVDRDVFVDPFARGAVLDRRGAEARFHVVQGPGAAFDPAFLEPVGRRAIVARLLANLRGMFIARGDTRALAWVLRLRLAVPGTDPAERRSYAGVLRALGRIREAAAQLDLLAAETGDETVAHAAARLRATLN